MVLAATSPISATANRNSTTTLSPSMRSAWRSTQALPANGRGSRCRRRPRPPASVRGEDRAPPGRTSPPVRRTPRPAPVPENGVAATQASSSASVTAAFSPISAASAGDAKIGGATTLSMRARSNPGERSNRSNALRLKPTSTGTISMVQTAAAIRSHGLANCARSAPGSTRRKARQSSRKTVSGKNGRTSAPSGGSSDPEQDRNGDGMWCRSARARRAPLPADREIPSYRLRHNSRAGSRRVRRLHIGCHVDLKEVLPWPEPMRSCWAPALSARRRRCISPNAGLAVALVDRRGPGEETSYGNAGVIEGNTLFAHAFPKASRELLRIALKQAPEANYHLSFLPKFAPWLLAYRSNTRAEGSLCLCRGDAAAVFARGQRA